MIGWRWRRGVYETQLREVIGAFRVWFRRQCTRLTVLLAHFIRKTALTDYWAVLSELLHNRCGKSVA